jgi:phage gp46-like protein
MIALAYDNAQLEGNLVYSGGRMVDEGYDLETSTIISLLCNARAQPGDVLPIGTNRRGWWGDSYDDSGEQLGSMLWLLEDEIATPENARRAEQYAQDALKWQIDEGHVLAIETESLLQSDAIWLRVTHTLLSGERVTLSPFKVS